MMDTDFPSSGKARPTGDHLEKRQTVSVLDCARRRRRRRPAGRALSRNGAGSLRSGANPALAAELEPQQQDDDRADDRPDDARRLEEPVLPVGPEQQVPQEATDEGPDDPDHNGGEDGQVLLSWDEQARDGAGDQADDEQADDETDHVYFSLFPMCTWRGALVVRCAGQPPTGRRLLHCPPAERYPRAQPSNQTG